jgi:hypothetical protein
VSIDPAESRSKGSDGRAAAAAIVLATIAGAWLAVWPCSYSGTTSGPSGASTTCSSLIAENGVWVIGYLLIPIVVTILGFLAVAARRRTVARALAILLLVLCVLAAWSIGLFYIPAAVTLVIAAARMDRTPTDTGPAAASVGDR